MFPNNNGARNKIGKVFLEIFFENFRNLDKNQQKQAVNTRLGTIKPLNFSDFKSRAVVAESERYICRRERDQHNEIKAESYLGRLRETNPECRGCPLSPSPFLERVRQPVNAPIKGETSRWTREIDTRLISRGPRVSVATASQNYHLTYPLRNIDIQGVPSFATSVRYHPNVQKNILILFLSEMLGHLSSEYFYDMKYK